MKTLFFISVYFILSTFLSATIINVPADQPTIQEGINVAVDGDTVLVQPGTYVENINYNGKLITVASLFLTTQDTTYISQTIIDGDSIDTVVKFESGENPSTLLTGFTITNGSAEDGGGIYCTYNSSPSLVNVTISGNHTLYYNGRGGGINCNDSNPSLENVTITGNSAADGGGIYCENSSPSLDNVTITGNYASDDGGGISCWDNSSPSLENVKITGNSADGGGGIYCENSSPILQNVTITGNYASDDGGGISCWDNSNPSLDNATITDNSANRGGGISCYYNSNPSLDNATITGNSASNYGGGIYCENSSPILQNVTISGNYANHAGGGICCELISSPSFDPVDRCNIYYNYAGLGCDLFAYDCPTIDIIVDTFTVLQPDDYLACPINNFTFDILYTKVEQVDQDLYVSPDGSNNNSGLTVDDPLLTISYALIKILPDSTNHLTIYLSNGTYSPSRTGEIFPLYCKSYVSLLGEDEASTILDGEELSGILVCVEDNNFSIENMTIQNGSAEYYAGGGIRCSYNSNPSLENVTISGNSSDIGGGGICCYNNSSSSLQNVTISDNSTNGHGGGIRCSYDSSPSLENVTIIGNSSIMSGGGIYGIGSSSSLENVTISGNSTESQGGGIYCEYSNPSLVNVTISGNFADGSGGGILFNNSSPSLVNITITGNTATNNGGGICCITNSSPNLNNCIMWNDSPQEVYFSQYFNPSSISISYTDIQGGETGIVTNNNGTVNWLEGNIDEDPLFVGTGEFPYALLEDSPCIDVGNPDPIYYDPEDPTNPGYALYPSMGTIINDMGAYGGPNAIGWPAVDIEEPIIPNSSSLITRLSNYPNPFNPTTTINYSLKENSKVELNIYNIKGQKVKQLVSDQLSAGNHSVIWYGKDNNGKPSSSGIYFYQLKAGGYSKIKKMLLLK